MFRQGKLVTTFVCVFGNDSQGGQIISEWRETSNGTYKETTKGKLKIIDVLKYTNCQTSRDRDRMLKYRDKFRMSEWI